MASKPGSCCELQAGRSDVIMHPIPIPSHSHRVDVTLASRCEGGLNQVDGDLQRERAQPWLQGLGGMDQLTAAPSINNRKSKAPSVPWRQLSSSKTAPPEHTTHDGMFPLI